jgi:predicted alpha-1,6-mannanase (GH76 family)
MKARNTMTRVSKAKVWGVLSGLLISTGVATADVAVGQDLPGKTVKSEVEGRAKSNVYLLEAAAGINTLQSWYTPTSGLYETTGWWNSANAITVLANFSKVTGSRLYLPVLQNTFTQAQHVNNGFLNHYYDDEGWWALAWIGVYDVTQDQRYLSMAQSIFEDMAGGWDTKVCGGGIWWSKDRQYKNAIANELFLSVAARLGDRTADPAQKAHYVGWARTEWQWFSHSGMINQYHLINDGLDSSDPLHCINNGQAVYTYNQGVVLGGLVALSKTNRADPTLLATAREIADAALLHLTDVNGVLHDGGEAKSGPDGVQFKGIFVRNLMYLDRISPNVQYKNFLTVNADSIWNNSQGPDHQFGQVWSGPHAPTAVQRSVTAIIFSRRSTPANAAR